MEKIAKKNGEEVGSFVTMPLRREGCSTLS